MRRISFEHCSWYTALPLLLLFFGFLLAANGEPARFDVDLQILGFEAGYFCLNRECLIRLCYSYVNRVKQFGFGLEPIVELMAEDFCRCSRRFQTRAGRLSCRSDRIGRTASRCSSAFVGTGAICVAVAFAVILFRLSRVGADSYCFLKIFSTGYLECRLRHPWLNAVIEITGLYADHGKRDGSPSPPLSSVILVPSCLTASTLNLLATGPCYLAALSLKSSRTSARFGSACDNSPRDEGGVAWEQDSGGVTDRRICFSLATRKQISSIASSSAATNSLGRSADDPKHF